MNSQNSSRRCGACVRVQKIGDNQQVTTCRSWNQLFCKSGQTLQAKELEKAHFFRLKRFIFSLFISNDNFNSIYFI